MYTWHPNLETCFITLFSSNYFKWIKGRGFQMGSDLYAMNIGLHTWSIKYVTDSEI